jgi:hypothetical protein
MPYLFEEDAVERAAVLLGEMSRPVAPHPGTGDSQATR